MALRASRFTVTVASLLHVGRSTGCVGKGLWFVTIDLQPGGELAIVVTGAYAHLVNQPHKWITRGNSSNRQLLHTNHKYFIVAPICIL